MNVTLEKAVKIDAPALLEMQKICFAPHLQRYQDYEISPALETIDKISWLIENEKFFKILCDGICVGALNIRKLDDVGGYKLHIINILPEHQGKGIGQAAIRLAEDLFTDAKVWCLETLADMPSNRHVYEKMGYQFTGKAVAINDKLTLVYYKKVVG